MTDPSRRHRPEDDPWFEPEPGGRRDGREPFPGHALLRGEDPEEILLRIADGDPLGLFDRGQARMRAKAVLMDPMRLLEGSVARVAMNALDYRGEPELARFLSDSIDQAIADTLVEDLREERAGLPIDEGDGRYAYLADTLGVGPEDVRRACVAFHELPEPVRAAFWAVVIDGKAVQRHANEAGVTLEEAQRRVDRAFRTISNLGHAIPPEDEL